MFDVEPDADRPFIVETFACDVKVLGTHFNVIADEAKNLFSTALFRGKVAVVKHLSDESVLMDENSVVNLKNGHLQIAPIEDPDEYRWPEGIITLNRMPFDQIVEKLERYYDVKIVIERSELPVIKYQSCKIRVSTDKSDCKLSFASPVGLLLSCNHLYNQYIFLDDSGENLQRFEKSARNMQSLSKYSRSNQINKEWIDLYLNDAHSFGLTSVRAHCNVIAWTDNPMEVKNMRNDVGSQIAMMECKPRHNTVDAATLYWAAMPGNGADFPAEESFYTFIEQALCFWVEETNYRSSVSPFGLKMSDRISGKPLHVDISDLPMKRGVTTNRNKFVLGGSGSGKSFFMNHLARQYYEQGTHVVLIDTGNSYQGLCSLIHQKTGGKDGIYFTYTDENPIAFNPFFTDDKVFDIEKRESIKTLILTLWKKDNEPATRSEEVALSNAVALYIRRIKEDESIVPSFNTFYEFVKTDYRKILEEKGVREKDFDLAGFLNVLEPYYRGGEYDFLLNSDKQLDLLGKRFIVFEIDQIKDHPILFPVTTIIIMELFINKMRRLKGVRKMIIIEEAWLRHVSLVYDCLTFHSTRWK